MKVESVSEQVVRWESAFPAYQVYFFERGGRQGGGKRHPGGTIEAMTYSYRITDAHNVHQVFAWADANAQGRPFIVYVEHDDAHLGVGVLQLSGDNPYRPWDPRRDPPPELDPGPVKRLGPPGERPETP